MQRPPTPSIEKTVILVDTSVWIDHFRKTDRKPAELLDEESVVMHPFVIAELALGHLPRRYRAIETLQLLPSVPLVS